MSFWVGGFHLGLLSLFFMLFFEPVDLTGDEATETFFVDEALDDFFDRTFGATLIDFGADFARTYFLTIRQKEGVYILIIFFRNSPSV